MLASIFFGIEKMVLQNTLESLPQYLKAANLEVKQELPCWKNDKDEEGGKAVQDGDWGRDFSQWGLDR